MALEVEESLDDLPALSWLVMDVVESFFFAAEVADLELEEEEEEAGLVILVLPRERIHWATLCQSWVVNISPKVQQITLNAKKWNYFSNILIGCYVRVCMSVLHYEWNCTNVSHGTETRQ